MPSVQMHGTEKPKSRPTAGNCSIRCTPSCSKNLSSHSLVFQSFDNYHPTLIYYLDILYVSNSCLRGCCPVFLSVRSFSLAPIITVTDLTPPSGPLSTIVYTLQCALYNCTVLTCVQLYRSYMCTTVQFLHVYNFHDERVSADQADSPRLPVGRSGMLNCPEEIVTGEVTAEKTNMKMTRIGEIASQLVAQ